MHQVDFFLFLKYNKNKKKGEIMIKYNFYTENDVYYCDLTYNDLTFTGEARCHPDDQDVKSERTGYFIAETRVNIEKLRWCRDYEVMPMVKHYRHFYDCLSHSSKFNPDSYETKRIKWELKKWENALTEIREEIKNEREYLTKYISEKDKLYQKIRKGKSN